jgi:quercetin dioxygenase-like cupin family protein
MTGSATLPAVVRAAGDGQQRWFYGGGVHTWLATEEETGGAFLLFEDAMDAGKRTPLHTHPIAESHWILEGEVRYRIDDEDVEVGVGDFVLVQAGVPHAFLVLSQQARILTIQPSCVCEPFYRGASEPLEGSARETDFARIAESGRLNGGIEILGPPPF